MKITTFGLMVSLCVVMTGANALAEARAPQLVITAITGQGTQAENFTMRA